MLFLIVVSYSSADRFVKVTCINVDKSHYVILLSLCPAEFINGIID